MNDDLLMLFWIAYVFGLPAALILLAGAIGAVLSRLGLMPESE